MRVYLDNNATTPVHPAVLEALKEALGDVYGNASSIHKEGQTARRRFEDARESVARLIGAEAREVVFTSGGTESNNAAIFGAITRAGRHHIVTTTIEHPSVEEPVRELERRGHEVTFVSPDRNGAVPADRVIAAIRPDTRLVAMMLANNETGVIQPVADVARAARDRGIHMHTDAVQAAGKIDIDIETLGVDTLSLSTRRKALARSTSAKVCRSSRSFSADRRSAAAVREPRTCRWRSPSALRRKRLANGRMSARCATTSSFTSRTCRSRSTARLRPVSRTRAASHSLAPMPRGS